MNKYAFLGLLLILGLSGCGAATTTSTSSTSTQADLKIAANFNKAPSLLSVMGLHPHTPAGFSDSSAFTDMFITPSEYRVAFKSIQLVRSDGSKVAFFNHAKLADSTVADLTPASTQEALTTTPVVIPAGTYSAVMAEVYYIEVKIPIGAEDTLRRLRIYFSDDVRDGGTHHQGDITVVDSTENEIGWIQAPDFINGISPRPSGVYAGGTDEATGRERGPFGDAAQWNNAATNSSDDIFTITTSLGTVDVSKISAVLVTFDVKETWFYDDVDDNGKFNPADNGDAGSEGAHWAPLMPTVTISGL